MASYLSTTVIIVSCYSRDIVDPIGEPGDLGQGRTNSTVPVKVVAIINYRVAKTESVYVWGVVCRCACVCVCVCACVCTFVKVICASTL